MPSFFAPLGFPSGSVNAFNWLFMVECITVIVAAIFYLFYLNRLFGFLFATLLNLLLWRSSDAYFECSSLQISPLGGRLLFKDLRYSSRNQSLRVLTGTITLRYWFWRVRNAEDLERESTKQPCRINVVLAGVEWFLYNRTPVFDDILRRFGHLAPTTPNSEQVREEEEKLEKDYQSIDEPKDWQRSIDWLFEVLPIDLDIHKGSITLGNRATPYLLITGFHTCSGTYGAVKSRSKYDKYKQIYQFTFDNVKSVFRTNVDYDGGLAEFGHRTKHTLEQDEHFRNTYKWPQWNQLTSYKAFRYIMHSVYRSKMNAFLDKLFSQEQVRPWQGLARYANTQKGAEGHHRYEEYAKVATLLETPTLELSYYADTAGTIPAESPHFSNSPLSGENGDEFDVGNGDLPPEWGVDVVLNGGFLSYGPWTDRQRVALQKVFIPDTFFDQIATPRLKAGDKRLHTSLKILVTIGEQMIVRLPTREQSKNWRYGNSHMAQERPYGWIDLYLGKDTTFKLIVPSVCSSSGYVTRLDVHAVDVVATSSVNYSELFKAQSFHIGVRMATPVFWQDIHHWNLQMYFKEIDIWLLRDHMQLMTDLIGDFLSVDPTEYEMAIAQRFIPFEYVISIGLDDYRLHLYLNEGNVINNPGEDSDNVHFNLIGPSMKANLQIPKLILKAPVSAVSFSVAAEKIETTMTFPLWDTHASFIEKPQFGSVQLLDLQGTYIYHDMPSPTNVETLTLQVDLSGVQLTAWGFVLKHLIDIKDLYFGDFTHFLTLEEYRDRALRGLLGDPIDEKWAALRAADRPNPDNFEVRLDLKVLNSSIVAPQDFYSDEAGLKLKLPEVNLHLRNHASFMELGIRIDPIELYFFDQTKSPDLEHGPPNDSLQLSSIDISAHRLFGPQPKAAVYLCIWEFALGRLSGALTASSILSFGHTIKTLQFGMKDIDNAIPDFFIARSAPDVTVLNFRFDQLDIGCSLHQTCMLKVRLPTGFCIRSDDMPCAKFLKHLCLRSPELVLQLFVLPALSSTQVKFDRNDWLEAAAVHFDVELTANRGSSWYAQYKKEQRDYVATQDQETQRFSQFYKTSPSTSVQLHHKGLYLPMLQDRSNDRNMQSDERSLSSVATSSITGSSESGSLFWNASPNTSFPVHSSKAPAGSFSQQSSSTFSSQESDTSSAASATSSIDFDFQSNGFRNGEQTNSAAEDCQARIGPYSAVLASYKQRLGSEGVTFVPNQRIAISPNIAPEERTRKAGKHEMHICLEAEEPTNQQVRNLALTLSTSRHVSILVTPLMIDFLALPFTYCADVHPQRMLDAFQSLWYSQHAERLASPQSVSVLFSSPCIEVQAIQQADLQANSSSLTEGRTSLAQLVVQNPSMSAARSADRAVTLNLSCVASSFVLTFPCPKIITQQTSQSFRSMMEPSTDPAIFLQAQHARMSLSGNLEKMCTLAMSFGDLDVNFVEQAAEYLTCSAFPWYRSALMFAHMQAVHRTRSRQAIQYLISAILHVSAASDISTDALFLNRSFILVQSTDQDLRNDQGWKILAHIRHCLSLELKQGLLDSNIAAHILRPSADDLKDNEDALQYNESDFNVLHRQSREILRTWRSWEEAPSNPAPAGPPKTDILDFLYLTPVSPLFIELPEMAATVDTGKWRILFYDGQKSANHLSVGPVVAQGYMTKGARYKHVVNAMLTVEEIAANLDPRILVLIHHISTVRYYYEQRFRRTLAASQLTRPYRKDQMSRVTAVSFSVQASCLLKRTVCSAMGHGVAVEMVAQNLAISSLISMRDKESCPRLNHFTEISKLTLIASENVRSYRQSLGSIELLTLRANLSFRPSATAEQPATSNIFSSLNEFHLELPRSLLRLQAFFEEWSEDNLPQTRFALEELRRDLGLANEIRQTFSGENQEKVPSSLDSFVKNIRESQIALQGDLLKCLLEVKAANSLQVSYNIGRTSLKFLSDAEFHHMVAGIEVEYQLMLFGINQKAGGVLDVSMAEQLRFPTLRVCGEHVTKRWVITASLDSITANVSAKIFDSMLALSSKFGQDIADVVAVVKSFHKAAGPRKNAKSSGNSLIAWEVHLLLQHLLIAVHSPTTIQTIEADQMTGAIMPPTSVLQRHQWRASVTALALALTPQKRQSSTFVNSLATFSVDLDVSNIETQSENDLASPQISVNLPRINAVMQPAAINALADFIDFYVNELAAHKQRRAAEIAQMRKHVMQSLELETLPSVIAQGPSFIQSTILHVTAKHVSIAIPLELATDSKSKTAFVVSMESFSFSAKHATAGRLHIQTLVLQFVVNYDWLFREKRPAGDYHARNRILLPKLEASIEPKTISDYEAGKTRKRLKAQGETDGLVISCDPTVVTKVFQLVDVFKLSHDRFSRLRAEVASAQVFDATAADAASEKARLPPLERPTLVVEAMLTFNEGHITLFASAEPKLTSAKLHPPTSPLNNPSMPFRPKHRRGQSLYGKSNQTASEADEIIIPMLHIFATYEGHSRLSKHPSLDAQAKLGASTNTLYPSLIGFMQGSMTEIEKAVAMRDTHHSAATNVQGDAADLYVPETAMHLSLSLHIEASRLIASCHPRSPVQAALDWQGGGAVFSTEAGVRGFKLALRVEAISFDIGHEFSPEKCIRGAAAGLAGAVCLQLFEEMSEQEKDQTWHSLSMTINVSGISGGFNLRQLQDWLVFQETWTQSKGLWQAQTPNKRHSSFARSFSRPSPLVQSKESMLLGAGKGKATARATVKSVLCLVAMIGIDELSFTCFLGPSLGKMSLSIAKFASNIRSLPEISKRFALNFDRLDMKFGPTGKLSGFITLDATSFDTELHTLHGQWSNLLAMGVRMGRLTGTLDSDHRRLLALENDPFKINITDDWSKAMSAGHTALPVVNVSFAVELGNLKLVLTSSTAPTFLVVFQDIRLAYKDASSRSALAHASQSVSPVDDNNFYISLRPELANAMSGTPLPQQTVSVVRHIQFQSKCFYIVGFLHNFSNIEAWEVLTQGVRASLSVGGDVNSIHRQAALHVQPVQITKLHLRRIAPSEETTLTLAQWLDTFQRHKRSALAQIPKFYGKQESWHRGRVLEYNSDIRFEGDLDFSYSAQDYVAIWNDLKLFKAAILDVSSPQEGKKYRQHHLEHLKKGHAEDLEKDENIATSQPTVIDVEKPDSMVASDRIAAEKMVPKISFVKLKGYVQEPKIKGLGQATGPLIRFLRWTDEDYHRQMFTGIVLPLDGLLLILSDSYMRNLRKNLAHPDLEAAGEPS